jgi:hypothetical protein
VRRGGHQGESVYLDEEADEEGRMILRASEKRKPSASSFCFEIEPDGGFFRQIFKAEGEAQA